MHNPKKRNYECQHCGIIVGHENSMYSHLKRKHKISGPGCLAANVQLTSKQTSRAKNKKINGKKKKSSKKKPEQKKFNGFRGLDLYRGLPPNKNDVVIFVAVNLEVNITRGTNRIVEK